MQNTGGLIGPKYDTVPRIFKGQWHRWYSVQIWQRLDNRNVPCLWSNTSKRNLNLNWFENRWNDNYRFLAVRNSLHSPPCAGFCFCSPLFHPPIIFPISFSCSESKIYFLLSIAFISQAICKKNLRISSLFPAFCK